MASSRLKLPSDQKAPQTAIAAGEHGVALAPPAYGIGLADRQPIQRRREAAVPPNRTGLPDRLKAAVEALSGVALDDVRVRFNSSRPAELQALAYTQGAQIHVAPGQERHLSHEAWHVVQQKQGRVRATRHLKGTPLNDDATLEREAEVMGRRAVQLKSAIRPAGPVRVSAPIPAGSGSYKLVAGDGGRRVGSVMVHAGHTNVAEITDLGVDQAHRTQGIGRQLLAAAAHTSQQLGKAKIALAAQDTGSGRLIHWYRRMGFAQIGVHPSGNPQLEAPIGRVMNGCAQGVVRTVQRMEEADPFLVTADEMKEKIKQKFNAWKKHLKEGTGVKVFNTGYDNENNHYVSAEDWKEIERWWLEKKNKVKDTSTTKQKAVEIVVSPSSDKTGKHKIHDLLANASDGVKFNFHVSHK